MPTTNSLNLPTKRFQLNQSSADVNNLHNVFEYKSNDYGSGRNSVQDLNNNILNDHTSRFKGIASHKEIPDPLKVPWFE